MMRHGIFSWRDMLGSLKLPWPSSALRALASMRVHTRHLFNTGCSTGSGEWVTPRRRSVESPSLSLHDYTSSPSSSPSNDHASKSASKSAGPDPRNGVILTGYSIEGTMARVSGYAVSRRACPVLYDVSSCMYITAKQCTFSSRLGLPSGCLSCESRTDHELMHDRP